MLNDQVVYPLKVQQLDLHIRQWVLPHLLWTGLSAGAIFVNDDAEFLKIPIALFGPLVAFTNVMKSKKANELFVKYISDNNLINRTIKSGETLEGVLVLKSFTHGQLNIEVIE